MGEATYYIFHWFVNKWRKKRLWRRVERYHDITSIHVRVVVNNVTDINWIHARLTFINTAKSLLCGGGSSSQRQQLESACDGKCFLNCGWRHARLNRLRSCFHTNDNLSVAVKTHTRHTSYTRQLSGKIIRLFGTKRGLCLSGRALLALLIGVTRQKLVSLNGSLSWHLRFIWVCARRESVAEMSWRCISIEMF